MSYTYIDKRRIGQNIKIAAIEKGIKLCELAEKADIECTQMYRYTQGRNTPGCVTLYRIAQALCVTMDSLMEGVEVTDED